MSDFTLADRFLTTFGKYFPEVLEAADVTVQEACEWFGLNENQCTRLEKRWPEYLSDENHDFYLTIKPNRTVNETANIGPTAMIVEEVGQVFTLQVSCQVTQKYDLTRVSSRDRKSLFDNYWYGQLRQVATCSGDVYANGAQFMVCQSDLTTLQRGMADFDPKTNTLSRFLPLVEAKEGGHSDCQPVESFPK